MPLLIDRNSNTWKVIEAWILNQEARLRGEMASYKTTGVDLYRIQGSLKVLEAFKAEAGIEDSNE